MSHVDEGVLHAYLDGALDALAEAGELPDGASAADVLTHLRVCADCRSRLEAERAVREAAGLVLKDVALTHVDVPPLSALDSRRRTRRWLPLSWAASVLLAVGAGWWGSEVWRAEPVSFATGDRVTQESAAVTDVGPGVQTDEVRPEGMGSARAANPPASDAARDAEFIAAAPAPPPPAPAAVTEQVAAEGVRSEPRIAAAPPPPPVPSAVTEQAAAPARQSAGAEPLSTAAVREPLSAEPVGGYLSFAPGARAPGIQRPTDPQIASEADADAGAIVPAAFDTILARESSGLIQFAAPGTAAQSHDSAQVYILAGATNTSWEAAREIGQTTVRIRQTLSTGVPVELLSWKPVAIELSALVVGADARVQADTPPGDARGRSAAGEPEQKVGESGVWVAVGPVRRLEDGRREIVVHAGGSHWLAIRADLSEDALRELVLRLRRPEPGR